MDGKEYLKQISGQVRPEKKKKSGGVLGIFSSTAFKVAGIGAAVIIVFLIVWSAVTGGDSIRDKEIRLKLRVDNLSEVITEYQPSVKSSDLRSSSASLGSILSNTSRELTDYMTNKFGYKDGDVSSGMKEEATLNKDALMNDLFEAKINGILDRIYARKIAYEISSVMNAESEIYKAASDAALKELIITSYDSLNNLYDKFDESN